VSVYIEMLVSAGFQPASEYKALGEAFRRGEWLVLVAAARSPDGREVLEVTVAR
jgi:hypothetical protein